MPNDANRIYLVGYRGCGKSTVGRLLATQLDWEFTDADDVFEKKSGKSIAQIFVSDGEVKFRALESSILRELSTSQQVVIATGGGAILSESNRQLLRLTGFCVWLTASPATLFLRLQDDPTTGDRRPALSDLSGLTEVEALLSEREPLYREVAHLVVPTENQSPEAIVSTILSAWTTSSSVSP